MTPQQKAKELIDNFSKFQTYTTGFEIDKHSEFVRMERAKQCALICVDEIMDALGKPIMQSYEEWEEHNGYWQQVRNEIINYK